MTQILIQAKIPYTVTSSQAQSIHHFTLNKIFIASIISKGKIIIKGAKKLKLYHMIKEKFQKYIITPAHYQHQTFFESQESLISFILTIFLTCPLFNKP